MDLGCPLLRGSFVRRLRRRATTLPPLLERTFPSSTFFSGFAEVMAAVRDLEEGNRSFWLRRLSGLFRPGEMSNRLFVVRVFRAESSIVGSIVRRLPLYVPRFMEGVEMGDSIDGSGDFGLYCSLSSLVCVAIAILFKILKKFGGRFKSIRLGGTYGSCRTNPYGIVGSLELSFIVKMCGSGDAIDDIEGIRVACCSDISDELRILGVLCLCGLGSVELCST